MLNILSGASAIIAEGESTMQLRSASNLASQTEAHYMTVVSAKTAALFAAAAEGGAVLTGKDQAFGRRASAPMAKISASRFSWWMTMARWIIPAARP